MTDSLKIIATNHKIDSLNQIIQNQFNSIHTSTLNLENLVENNTIAQGFFTYIIALQLAVFIIVVGFLGLIAWKAITMYLKKNIDSSEVRVNEKIEELHTWKKGVDHQINKLLLENYRSMYLISKTSESWNTALIWACRLMEEINQNFSLNDDEIWMTFLDSVTPKLEKENVDSETYLELMQIFEKVKASSSLDIDHAKKIEEYRKLVFENISYKP